VNINDRVDQISATIQELRQASADNRRSRQLVDSLFRTVHTFKAAASAEDLTDLSRTAHEFENLLHALRIGKVTLDPEVFRVFDETVVALRNGSEAATLNRFNETTRGATTGDGELPPGFPNLKDDERHRALAALREGANLYVMNVEFAASDFDERFRQLKEQLEKVAELISTSATMKDDKIIFRIVYASRSEKIPVRTVLQQAIHAGKSVAAKLGKNVTFVLRGDEFLLDKPWAEVLADASIHLVRNAVDHGIESEGTVILETTANQITVTDDGRGITPDNLPLLFQPGFSTAPDVTELSGRGVGLDAVKTAVEEFGGSVSVTSEPGQGSSFKITMPDQITTPNPSSDS
jgi:two-component system, chemotaxis family, sensor kinase CheA